MPLAPNTCYVVWDGQPTDDHEPFFTSEAAVARARELLDGGARTVNIVTANWPLEPERKVG